MSDVFSFLHEVAAELAALRGDIASVEARMERMLRKGKVTDVDAANQKYRQEIGLDDDGNPVKSPWIRYAQFGGARRIHTPPTVGQQFLMISPDGDHEQAHGIPLTFSKDNPSPSQNGDEHVDQFGTAKDTLKADERLIEVGGASIDVKDGKIVFTATNIVLVGNIALGADGASRELALRNSVDTAGDKLVDNLSTKVKAL